MGGRTANNSTVNLDARSPISIPVAGFTLEEEIGDQVNGTPWEGLAGMSSHSPNYEFETQLEQLGLSRVGNSRGSLIFNRQKLLSRKKHLPKLSNG